MKAHRPTRLGGTLLLLAAATVLTACGGARLAVVDTEQILNSSVRALSYQRQLDESEKRMALDLQLLRNRLSPADLQARQTQYLRELQQLKVDLEERLNKEIRDLVGQIVRERGLRGAVIIKNPVLYAMPGRTVDITPAVIDRLR